MYYTKTELFKILAEIIKEVAERNVNFISKPDEALKELADDRDAISIAWNEKKMLSENKEGIALKMYTFIKVAGGLYCDDYYCIDAYTSAVQKKDLAEVIRTNMKIRNGI